MGQIVNSIRKTDSYIKESISVLFKFCVSLLLGKAGNEVCSLALSILGDIPSEFILFGEPINKFVNSVKQTITIANAQVNFSNKSLVF